ncbi:MAG: hypothetical protein PHU21_03790 [Elusimicrobia bacterium]|nr:hypothetical protein [Elusimicrobiota bacterium]
MTREKMVAYLRQNLPKYGLAAVKEDLIKRQKYPLLEVEAACLEALKPEDPLRKVKSGLAGGAAAGMVALLVVLALQHRQRPPEAPAPAAEPVPLPAPPPARLAVLAGPADTAGAAKALESGVKAFKAYKLEEALAAFDEAAHLDPHSAPARSNRGIVRLNLARRLMGSPAQGEAAAHFQKGRQDLRDCAAMDPELGRQTARSLAHDGAQWVRREQEAGRKPIDTSFLAVAMDLAGDDPKVLNEAASAYLWLGEAQKALGMLDRALFAEPGYFEAHLNRASALNALGRPAEALTELNAAEKLAPARPEIRQLRELIGAAAPPER